MNKQLGSLFLVSVIDILGFGIVIPLVPYMADRYGAPPEVITPILGSYSLCQLIAAPLWGRLSDRYGRRMVLMTSLSGACVSYVILGLAGNIWWLLVSRMLAGFMAGNLAAAFAYASDVSTPEKRAGALGLVGAAIGIGFSIGPAVGGVLAGSDPRTASFALPAVVSACLSVLAIVLVALVLPESHPGARRWRSRPSNGETEAESGGPALEGVPLHAEAHRVSSTRPLRLLMERPSLRFTAGAALLVTISQAILESIFTIWALKKFGFGPRTVGLLMFCLALVAVLMQGLIVRSLAPRLGEARLAAMGVCVYVAGLVAVSQAPNLALTVIALALCGAGVGAFNPSASALASRQSSSHDRGAVMGTYQSSSSLARVIGPFISGPIYAAFGPGAPFLVGACVTLPAVWLVSRAGSSSSTSVPAQS